MERGPATAVEHPLAGRHPLSNSLQLPPNQARNAAAPIEVITNDVENHAWTEYPQSLFPNWTPQQLSRSGIADALLERKKSCIIHHVDVLNDGTFAVPKKYKHVVTADHADQFWEELQQEVSLGNRPRLLNSHTHTLASSRDASEGYIHREPVRSSPADDRNEVSSLRDTCAEYFFAKARVQIQHRAVLLLFIFQVDTDSISIRYPSPARRSSVLLPPPEIYR